jgi:hypothetical protein
MKLCPQCEFIYEDDQNLCDMDGEVLVNDSRVGSIPGTLSATISARPTRSRLKIAPLHVVAGLVLSALLFIAYCTTTPVLNSKVSRIGKPKTKETGLRQQLTPPSGGSQDTSSQSPANPVVASESVNSRADESTAKPLSEAAPSQSPLKASDNARRVSDKRLTIARGLPPLRQLTPLPRLSRPKRLAQRTSNQKAVVVEVKPVTGKSNKPSRVTTLFKKTTRLLKKPFRF